MHSQNAETQNDSALRYCESHTRTIARKARGEPSGKHTGAQAKHPPCHVPGATPGLQGQAAPLRFNQGRGNFGQHPAVGVANETQDVTDKQLEATQN